MTEKELLELIEKAAEAKADFLDLSNCQIHKLPSEIEKLVDLKALDISNNLLENLPSEIGKLTHLKTLNVRRNPFSEIPYEIKNLDNLENLDISFQGFDYFDAVGIEFLKIKDVFSEGLNTEEFNIKVDFLENFSENLILEISCLINLKKLNISNSKLKILPPEIGNLVNLRELDLSNNYIVNLPSEIKFLSQINLLNLRNNYLEDMPEEVLLLKKAKVLYSGNPFPSIPPEVRKRGWNSVRNFLAQKSNQELDVLYEAKLLIIGEGGAGKTSLARKIEDDSYQLNSAEQSTEGIDVIQWTFPYKDGKAFRVNVWDFGGQEIYHATHQFFLTKRSLYILVADSRKEDTDFFYWLNVVDLLSETSPILIVKNEKQDRQREINERQLRGEFRNLEKILATNLADNRGLSEIKQAIQHYITQLDHVGTELPKTWVQVREGLETETCNHITLAEYLQICRDNGFTEEEDALLLLGYLHDLGVCLHFEKDDLLRRTVILKPTWGTDAVYRVLDNSQVIHNLGKFTRDDLANIWHEAQYAQMRPELLRLMMNFKLCYEIPGSANTYIAPQLLSLNQPDYGWNEANNLFLRYTYDFMPKGILIRFIVEMHRWIEDQACVWKTGVVLNKDGARAEVLELYHRKEIRIRVAGSRCRDLLTTIRHELDKIHADFDRLKCRTLVPCNCQTCQGSQDPHFYPLDKLHERRDNGKPTIECGNAPYQDVEISTLIDDVTPHRPAQPTMRDQVFISYSHQDADWLEQLQVQLKPYIRNRTVTAWDDTQIQAGSEWRQDIDQALAAARVAVLLVSPDFLASDFIADNELPPLLEAAENEGLTILWVPIRHSAYEETEIEKYQAAHPPNQPLASLSASERDKAWVDICKKIKQFSTT